MRTKYKHIHFVEVEKKPKTLVFSIIHNNTNDDLGTIKWHAPWRQYCSFMDNDIVLSASCHMAIFNFINKLMKARGKK